MVEAVIIICELLESMSPSCLQFHNAKTEVSFYFWIVCVCMCERVCACVCVCVLRLRIVYICSKYILCTLKVAWNGCFIALGDQIQLLRNQMYNSRVSIIFNLLLCVWCIYLAVNNIWEWAIVESIVLSRDAKMSKQIHESSDNNQENQRGSSEEDTE